MPTHPLETYLIECRDRRSTGATTDETGLYSPLESLLNAAGDELEPRVRCFMSLRDQGAGLPDGGLFTPDQIGRGTEAPPIGQAPSRGVIECKKPIDHVLAIADTNQVSRYWSRYNQVLVTNYWEFLLIGRDESGNPVRHEHYRLATDAADFWRRAARPAATVKEHGPRLIDFFQRCLLRPAPLTEPKDLAWFLASYARDARERVERTSAHEPMESVRLALEDALGLVAPDAKAERFFQSTLVQTLFYGVFSAWVLWHRSHPATSEKFDWERASRYLHVPILRKLFRELTDPAQLDSWENLTEVMDWATDTLNRVDRGAFFARFRDAEAVQYFYEPFLEAFDPELRVQLGVWYTPPEIVQYMVARVDQTLKTEFGRPDGLADPGVFVLDPCCGTGAYLVEALRTIAANIASRGEDALLARELKEAAMHRVFGFEILPAPFVVAHLQLGLFLRNHGAELDEGQRERAAVYLTNALTGWQPPTGPQSRLLFPEMEEERDRAEQVKQQFPILVVLGNPPYYGKTPPPMPMSEESDLVQPYREVTRAPAPRGQGLNESYVRFFRIAERCITERHRLHGIVCYISNYSWLDGLSHTGMRERFEDEFDQVWIDSLNGDKFKTGKTTPQGDPDPSVFSTAHNREGIQVGTAVALLARRPDHHGRAVIRFREFWGDTKREDILASLKNFQASTYEVVDPVPAFGLPFRPNVANPEYALWPRVVELFPISFPGVKTSRDEDLVDTNRVTLQRRIEKYFDPSLSDAEARAIVPRLLKNTRRFNATTVRATLTRRGMIRDNVVPYSYRPFDQRWVYWEPLTKLLDEKRPELFPQVASGNYFLFTTGRTRKDQIEPAIVTQTLTDLNLMDSGARGIPMMVRTERQIAIDQEHTGEFRPNSSRLSEGYLADIRGSHVDLFFHCLSVIQSETYRADNFSGLKSDWPRIPLPAELDSLRLSAELGRRVAVLLDPETPIEGVTAGDVATDLKYLAIPATVAGGQFSTGDFEVNARWGYRLPNGAIMPGTGGTNSRRFSADESNAIGETGIELFGESTVDVYLNATAYWRNVPERVWEFTLGGYKVLKKWLSYRDVSVLGRPLSLEEVRLFTQIARRIAAIVLLGPDLNANYQRSRAHTHLTSP